MLKEFLEGNAFEAFTFQMPRERAEARSAGLAEEVESSKVSGHRPAWNCCSSMGLLLTPEIAPESQAVRHLWAQQHVTNTGETIKLVSKNEMGDPVDSLPRSECITKMISRFLLSEAAPNPLLLGQFHISSLAAGGRCSLAGFSGTCSCNRLELHQENCLIKENSSFLTARDCASAGQ